MPVDKRERLFPCDKAIVLNAVYDALDAIGFTIEKSDSARGTLTVSPASSPEATYRIALTPSSAAEETAVEVLSPNGEGTPDGWTDAMFDEMRAILRKAGVTAAGSGDGQHI